MNQSIIPIKADKFTNVFAVAGRKGAILIDAGNPGCADAILKGLAEHDLAPDDVRLILITHGHVDHFGSAAALREQTGAPVAIHAADAEALRRGTHMPGTLNPTNRWVAFLMHSPIARRLAVPDCASAFEPDITFADEWRLDEPQGFLQSLQIELPQVRGRVLHTPGHTPGSISVLLDDYSGNEQNGVQAAIVGDMIMGKLMGFWPRPGQPIVAWDMEQNRESRQRLLSLSPAIVYVGHGGPFHIDSLRQHPAG